MRMNSAQEADKGSSHGCSPSATAPPWQRSQRFVQGTNCKGANRSEASAGLAQLQQRWALLDSDMEVLTVKGSSRVAKQLHLASEATLGGWRAGLYAPRIRAEATARAVAAGSGRNPDGPGTALANGYAPQGPVSSSSSHGVPDFQVPWRPPAAQAQAWQRLLQGMRLVDAGASSDNLPYAQPVSLKHLIRQGTLDVPVDDIIAELQQHRDGQQQGHAQGSQDGAREPAQGAAAGRDPPCPHRANVGAPSDP